jgi:hypothetical protein
MAFCVMLSRMTRFDPGCGKSRDRLLGEQRR